MINDWDELLIAGQAQKEWKRFSEESKLQYSVVKV